MLLGTFVFEFAQVYLMQYTGQLAMFDLRKDLMAHLQGLDLAFFDRNPVGRLVTRVTTDVDVLNDLFASGLVTILGDVLVLGFIVAIMFNLSPGLTLLMLGVMPLVILVTAIFRRSVTQSYRRIRIAIAKINAYLQEHVTGIVVLQLFNREAKSRQRVRRRQSRAHGRLQGRDYGLRLVLPGGGVPFHAGAGGHPGLWRLPRPAGRAHAGRGGGVSAIRTALLPPHSGPQRKVQHPARRHGVCRAHLQAAGHPSRHPAAAESAVRRPTPARIEFDHVWFAYKDDDWVLRDVSFAIEPGETIAVVGHTGAGKTTLISLLLRFYDVQKGAIRVGGSDVRELDPAGSAPPIRRRLAGSVPVYRVRSKTISGWAPLASTARPWKRPPNR